MLTATITDITSIPQTSIVIYRLNSTNPRVIARIYSVFVANPVLVSILIGKNPSTEGEAKSNITLGPKNNEVQMASMQRSYEATTQSV